MEQMVFRAQCPSKTIFIMKKFKNHLIRVIVLFWNINQQPEDTIFLVRNPYLIKKERKVCFVTTSVSVNLRISKHFLNSYNTVPAA